MEQTQLFAWVVVGFIGVALFALAWVMFFSDWSPFKLIKDLVVHMPSSIKEGVQRDVSIIWSYLWVKTAEERKKIFKENWSLIMAATSLTIYLCYLLIRFLLR